LVLLGSEGDVVLGGDIAKIPGAARAIFSNGVFGEYVKGILDLVSLPRLGPICAKP
jgi:hypothetical protein